MRQFFVAILMAILLVWSSEAKAFVPGYCPPIFCGQTPPGGSTGDPTATDADTTNNTNEEEGCLEESSNEPRVSGHEVLREVDGLVEVRFPVVGFIPGNVKEFRGWLPTQVFDRQCETNLSDITVGVYFHSDGMNGRFQTEGLRLMSYVRKNQKPGELLIAISRPQGFDLTQVNHGKEVEAQAMLIDYLDQTFGLGETIELYGHGAETIAIALTVHPVIKRVTAFPRTLREEGQEAYYYLLSERIKDLLPDGGSELKADLAYNPYASGQEVVEAFVDKVNKLGLNVTTSEVTGDQVVSDGSIAPEILADIEDQLFLNRYYVEKLLGIDTPPGIKVFIGNDPKWLTDKHLEALELDEGFRPWRIKSFSQCENVAEASFYAIFFSACHESWKNPERRKSITFHELWHTHVQYYLLNAYCCTGSDRMQHVGPEWLMEGPAEVWDMLMVKGVDFDLEQEMAWRRNSIPKWMPADFNLLDLNTRRAWREGSGDKGQARDLAALMLMATAGLHSFLDFYGNLGDYHATEAAKAGLDSTRGYGNNPQLAKFSREFFDPPERLEKLDEIFQAAFGRTMTEFAKEFRDSLR